jgi:hypothetical protein
MEANALNARADVANQWHRGVKLRLSRVFVVLRRGRTVCSSGFTPARVSNVMPLANNGQLGIDHRELIRVRAHGHPPFWDVQNDRKP